MTQNRVFSLKRGPRKKRSKFQCWTSPPRLTRSSSRYPAELVAVRRAWTWDKRLGTAIVTPLTDDPPMDGYAGTGSVIAHHHVQIAEGGKWLVALQHLTKT
jgi:hypothetical protein